MLPRVNTIHTEQGEYLLFATGDLISRVLYHQGQWERHLLEVSRFFHADQPQPLVLDIGANLGAYAVPVARELAERGGEVWAFEPQRIVHHQLCGNIVLNRLDNVIVHQCALGATAGEIEIPELDFGQADNLGGFSLVREYRERQGVEAAVGRRTRRVPMRRLDDLELPRAPALIKIDVEGYELPVLQGGADFLRRHGHPPVLFEAWGDDWYAEGRRALFCWFGEHGYRVDRVLKDDYLAQHPDFPVQVMLRAGPDNMLEVGRVR